MTALSGFDSPAMMNPAVSEPEVVEPGLVELLEQAGIDSVSVALYRGSNQQGAYLSRYDAAEFSLEAVQRDYGAGRYFAQIKKAGKVYRGVRFEIGPAPKSAEVAGRILPELAPRTPAPSPAPTTIDFNSLFLAMMNGQQQLMAALVKREPAPVPQSLSISDMLALADKFSKSNKPSSSLAELLEAMTALRAIGGDSGGSSEWAEVIKSIPSLLAAIPKPDANIENHPAVVQARRIVAMAEARSKALPSPPAAPAEPAPAEAAVSTIDPDDAQRVEFIKIAGPFVMMAAQVEDADPETYAQTLLDFLHANSIDPARFVGDTPGRIVDLFIQHHPAAASRREFIAEIEEAVRVAIGEQGPGPIDDDGNPRAGNPQTAPKRR